jgi:hypothetical protein
MNRVDSFIESMDERVERYEFEDLTPRLEPIAQPVECAHVWRRVSGEQPRCLRCGYVCKLRVEVLA